MSITSPTPRVLPPSLSVSRKRGPSVAFDDATPPSSRPPSRTHTKRCTAPPLERPSWVSERHASTRLDSRIDGSTLLDMRLPDGTVDAARPVAGLMHTGGFTVLCFLGPGGGATLEAVGALRGLLGGLGATAYGVSLLGEETGSMPIIHDVNRILTSRMGLLHPLGGGRTALDAVVVLDAESRARIVLPLGWGVRGALDDGGNRWENVVGRVVRGVEWLRMEMAERVVREMEGMEVEMLTV